MKVGMGHGVEKKSDGVAKMVEPVSDEVHGKVELDAVTERNSSSVEKWKNRVGAKNCGIRRGRVGIRSGNLKIVESVGVQKKSGGVSKMVRIGVTLGRLLLGRRVWKGGIRASAENCQNGLENGGNWCECQELLNQGEAGRLDSVLRFLKLLGQSENRFLDPRSRVKSVRVKKSQGEEWGNGGVGCDSEKIVESGWSGKVGIHASQERVGTSVENGRNRCGVEGIVGSGGDVRNGWNQVRLP
ncbi:hypothetical protein AAG906_019997 [Vitis piasezkii]